MNKQAISVSLERGNLLWLQALKAGGRHRSVSDALDSLIADVRAGRARRGAGVCSVRGTIAIAKSDPDLKGADAVLRSRFRASLGRRRRAAARKA
ncbi:MAG: hypothetical protein ACHQNV_02495 [Vicinamibacteria bacterium]